MTKERLLSLFSPQTHLAGGNDANKVGSPQSGFDFAPGIPAMYMAKGVGKKVVVSDMNGLARLVSQSCHFNSSGGYYTFDPVVAAAIGGYPLGAVLSWRDPESGLVRKVRSMKADNSGDFCADPSLIDGENWAFVDVIPPAGFRPRIFPDFENPVKGELVVSAGRTESTGFVAEVPSLFVVQCGFDEKDGTPPFASEALVWAKVRASGSDDFCTGALLAYIPPVDSAYGTFSQSARFIDPTAEGKAGYEPYYSASPISLYLSAGDEVRLSLNVPLSPREGAAGRSFSAKFVSFHLTTE